MTAILALTGTMIVQAFLFFLLEAYFLGSVQLIVYTGAVMVLFVMVVMIFNKSNTNKPQLAESPASIWLKISSVAWFSGLVAGIFFVSKNSLHLSLVADPSFLELLRNMSIKGLSQVLFTKYLLAFELMGVFLLMITVGVISIAKSKGGTHE